MIATKAMGALVFTALFAMNAMAAEKVRVNFEAGPAHLEAGKHRTGGTIVSVIVPEKMAVVAYDNSGNALAVFSFQNSGLKTKIANVASLEVVDRFPSKAEMEALLKKSEWTYTLYHADGAKVHLKDTLVFKNNKFSLAGAQSVGESTAIKDVGLRGGDQGTPFGGSCKHPNGNEIIYELITPTVMRSDEWDKGKKAGDVKNNPAQWLGVLQLKK
ncbi:MAG: hypothetical protein U0746_21125 [Gemmataceae bacterium]